MLLKELRIGKTNIRYTCKIKDQNKGPVEVDYNAQRKPVQ